MGWGATGDLICLTGGAPDQNSPAERRTTRRGMDCEHHLTSVQLRHMEFFYLTGAQSTGPPPTTAQPQTTTMQPLQTTATGGTTAQPLSTALAASSTPAATTAIPDTSTVIPPTTPPPTTTVQ